LRISESVAVFGRFAGPVANGVIVMDRAALRRRSLFPCPPPRAPRAAGQTPSPGSVRPRRTARRPVARAV